MALFRSPVRLAGAAVAAATEASTTAAESGPQLVAKAARAVRGEVNLPSRSIAAVLLRAGKPMHSKEIYHEAKEYGLLRSQRHFKTVLRMMKQQKRVKVYSVGPEKVGGNKLMFNTTLTRRGHLVYTRYLGENIPLPGETKSMTAGDTQGSTAGVNSAR